MDTNLKLNKAAIAFTYILLGLVVTSFPDVSISMGIAKFIAWIFMLIGQIKLISILDGNGRTGAILLLVATMVQLIMRAIGFSTLSINDFFSSTTTDFTQTISALSTLSSMMDGGMPTTDSITDLFETTAPIMREPIWEELLQNGLMIGAMALWLSYEPFMKAKSGIITLLIVYSVLFVMDIPAALGTNLPGVGVFTFLFTLVCIIAYVNIVKNTASSPQPTYAIILIQIGFLYTLLMLVDNSIKTAIYVIVGAVIFLMGNGKLRDASDRTGTGAFNCYGAFMIIAGFMMMIPVVGGILATILQVSAYLIVGIAFIRFGNNQVFEPSKSNGTMFAGFLILANIILAFVPTGTGIGAFIFCLFEIPLLLIAFRMAVNAVQLEDCIIATYGSHPTPTPKVETPRPQPQPQPVVEAPRRLSKEEEEEELIRKYGPRNLVETPAIVETDPEPEPAPVIVKPEYNATMFTYAETTNLRSSKLATSRSNIVSQIPYNTEVLVANQGEWSLVKWGDKEGYVESWHLLSKDDFDLLDSIFGDNRSMKLLCDPAHRMALFSYYKDNNLYGYSSREIPAVYQRNEKGWQAFHKEDVKDCSSIVFSKIRNENGKYDDLAMVISNSINSKKRMLIFTFDEMTSKPILFYEDPSPKSEQIKEIKYEMRGNVINIEVEYV